jgi:lysophospholipase L1-like esterase
MRIAPRSKLLMIGDSVTDCDRARPVGEGLFGAHGKGYVAHVDALLTAAYPAHAIRVVNMGTSGNTVRDLEKRWQTDVLDLKPDWLSIMIGINDVWRQFDSPRQDETHVGLDDYTAAYDRLLTATRDRVKGLVLMTPFYIEPLADDAMRARMDHYGTAVKTLAARHNCTLVDTQAAFNHILQHMHSANLAWDRVHPNHLGHMVLARAFLNAIGFAWSGTH